MKCILQGQEAWRIPMQMVSNPNLLINWDFRNPVNRNGQTEYTNTNYVTGSYFIDQWVLTNDTTATLTSKGITCDYKDTSFGTYLIYQNLDKKRESLTGKTVTLSVLVNEKTTPDSLGLGIQYHSDYSDNIRVAMIDQESGLFSGTTQIPDDIEQLLVFITSPFQAHNNISIAAMKLELGSTQTLARKNDAGEWELIDPPDYDLQYTLCEQYSPINGAFVGSQHSNPNLLDNSYWAAKEHIINQRGQMEYTVVHSYTIDRFIAKGTLILEDDGLYLTAESEGELYERLEQSEIEIGKKYTLSVLIDELDGTSHITTYGNREAPRAQVGMNTLTFIAGDETWRGIYPIYGLIGSCKVRAAKLELGPVQTLAHKEGDTWVLNDPPPDKTLELTKCRRYMQVFRTYDAPDDYTFIASGVVNANEGGSNPPTAAYFPINLCPAMRKKPTISTDDINKVVLYRGLKPITSFSVHSPTTCGDGITTLSIRCNIDGLNYDGGQTHLLCLKREGQIILDANL